MIVEDGDRLRIQGPITMQTVAGLLESGRSLCGGGDCAGQRVLDLSDAGPVDSAALALVIAWIRAANQSSRGVRIEGVPEQLRSLAALYDLGDLLPLDGATA